MQLNFLFLLAGILVCRSADALPASYDQRQTGDLNVQLDFKDIQVVALVDTDLLGDYVDYNYSYDYADFTIKPISKPTTSGSTTSVEPWHTWPTIPASSTTSSPSSSSSSSSSELEVISSTPTASLSTSTSKESLEPEKTTSASQITSTTQSTTEKKIKNYTEINRRDSISKECPSGYSSDAKGRCRKIIRRRLSFLPLMKLAPKISKEETSKDLRVSS